MLPLGLKKQNEIRKTKDLLAEFMRTSENLNCNINTYTFYNI